MPSELLLGNDPDTYDEVSGFQYSEGGEVKEYLQVAGGGNTGHTVRATRVYTLYWQTIWFENKLCTSEQGLVLNKSFHAML